MTKADLVEKVTALGDLTRRDGEVIVETIFGSVIGALQSGDKIEIRGFGSFRIRQRNPRIGRNPKTGARVEVPAKKVPYFKPSKELRDLVNPGEAEAQGFVGIWPPFPVNYALTIQPRSRPAGAGFPCFADADHRHHAPGVPVGGAMREEQLPLALRAAAHHLNRSRGKPAGEQLAAVGFDQIHVQAGPDGRVARRALRQKEHGIFGFDGVGGEDLAEEFARVRKLRFEF